MSFWSRLSRRTRKSNGVSSNPFSGRGLDKFALVSAELASRREAVAARTGVHASEVRFTAESAAEWIPIIPSSSRRKLPSLRTALVPDPDHKLEQAELEQAADEEELKMAVVWKQQEERSTRSKQALALLLSIALCKVAAARSIAGLTWATVSTASRCARSTTKQLRSTSRPAAAMTPSSPSTGSFMPFPSSNSSSSSPSSSRELQFPSRIRLSGSSSTAMPTSSQSAPPSPYKKDDRANSCSELKLKGRSLKPASAASSHDPSAPSSKKHPFGVSRSDSCTSVAVQQVFRKKLLKSNTVIGTVTTNRKSPPNSSQDSSWRILITLLVLLVVQAGLLAGQVVAIILTCCLWFLIPQIRALRNSTSRSASSSPSEAAHSEQRIYASAYYSSSEYRKKVIMEGLLQRPK